MALSTSDSTPDPRAALLPDALRPVFTSPRVHALMSTRQGGVSQGAFVSLNLRHGLGDDVGAVVENQARFAAALGAEPVWLRQVHGTRVLRLPLVSEATDATEATPNELPEADASITTTPGVACAVQVADCMPVLFAVADGRGVGAAHAGWRGLSSGVLEATVAALCEAAHCEPSDIEAWLGPCIGPRHFEVGADVLQGFGVPVASASGGDQAAPVGPARFVPDRPGKWLADLPGLARDKLSALGIARISGGTWCTVEDASRFFSFRRDTRLHGRSGRLAAAIWCEGADAR